MDAPSISPQILGFFRRIVRRYLRRHFHGVRLNGASNLLPNTGPLIIYGNHSSWWDPMVSIHLAAELMPSRRHYAPMDQQSLSRYAILRKVGIFPVERNTLRGAAQFLRTGTAILNSGGVLWVTPQGRFVDAQVRPLEFKPGLATLAVRTSSSLGHCTVQPLAIEYPFWDERLPEVLLNFGKPLHVSAGETAEQLDSRLIAALEDTMNQLRELAIRRDAGAFTGLSRGAAGVGGFYALVQRLQAILNRRPYQPEHTLTSDADPTHARYE